MFVEKRKGSDIASSVFIVAIFIFLVFVSMNILFQASTRARLSTGMDTLARYLATHKSVTQDQAKQILQNYISSSLITTTEIVGVGWTPKLNSACATSGTFSMCENDLKGANGLYNYRTPFVVVARFRIPPIAPIPFLLPVNTTLYMQSVTEIME